MVGAIIWKYILYNARCVYVYISRKRSGSLFCACCRSIFKRRLHLKWPCTPSRICRDLTDSFPFIIDVYRNDKAVMSILPLFNVLTLIDFIDCSSRYIPDFAIRLTLIAFITSLLLILRYDRDLKIITDLPTNPSKESTKFDKYQYSFIKWKKKKREHSVFF